VAFGEDDDATRHREMQNEECRIQNGGNGNISISEF
jgi:hypothetical protein